MSSCQPLTNVFDDGRYALRQITRNVGFTICAVFSLAVGIAAATTAFTIVDSFLLRRLPVQDPEHLFALSTSDRAGWTLWPYASFAAWRDAGGTSFDVAASSHVLSVPLERSAENRVRLSLVSGNYFRVLSVEMALGRGFGDSEGHIPLADPVVVMSETFWRRSFGADPAIVGKSITLNGTLYEVIGVTRSPFAGDHVGHPTDVWVPLSMLPAVQPGRQLLDDPFGIRRAG